MLELRVAIVEDEPLAADRLRQLLAEWPGGTATVVGEAESVAEAIALLPTWTALDLLLCDIRLGDGLSFNIWEHAEVPCPTVFTTAYEEYALRAFKVNSVDYLLKPVKPAELYATLTGFGESLRENRPAAGPTQQAVSPEVIAQVMAAMRAPRYRERFVSKVGDRLVPIAAADVAFFASVDRITWAYRFDGSRSPLPETLDQVEQALDPRRFARLNRATVAQARAIEQLTAYSNSRYRAQLSGHTGEPVIVARDRVRDLKAWLADAT